MHLTLLIDKRRDCLMVGPQIRPKHQSFRDLIWRKLTEKLLKLQGFTQNNSRSLFRYGSRKDED